MASPLPTGKQSIDLAKGAVRGSRIRRDPPPVEKELVVSDPTEREARMVIIGIITFALAIVVITLGFASAAGWSPRQYTAHF